MPASEQTMEHGHAVLHCLFRRPKSRSEYKSLLKSIGRKLQRVSFTANFRCLQAIISTVVVTSRRRDTAPKAGFPRQFEDGPAILRNHFEPGEAAHHGEINSAEAESRQEDVDAVAERLVIERLHGLR